jgi:hypothetical protein
VKEKTTKRGCILLIEIVKNTSFGLVIILGLGVSAFLIAWLYAGILNFIASVFKLHKEFGEFIQYKYRKGVYTPNIKE